MLVLASLLVVSPLAIFIFATKQFSNSSWKEAALSQEFQQISYKICSQSTKPGHVPFLNQWPCPGEASSLIVQVEILCSSLELALRETQTEAGSSTREEERKTGHKLKVWNNGDGSKGDREQEGREAEMEESV